MIANFTIMGSLYKHREYSTLATEWNTYPWVLGADNPIEQSIELDDFYSSKTIWESGEDNLGNLLFSLDSFSMMATLIRIDNLGNFGKAVDNPSNLFNPPLELRRNIGITEVSLNMTIKEVLVIKDSNSESSVSQCVGLTGISLNFISLKKTLVIEDSNSETNISQCVGITGVSLNMELTEV